MLFIGFLRSSEPSRTRSRALLVLLSYLLFWTSIGCVFSLPELGTDHYERSLRVSLAEFWAWGLVAPLIYGFDRRLSPAIEQLGRRVATHLIASVFFTIIFLYTFTCMLASLSVIPWTAIQISHVITRGQLGVQLWSWLVCSVVVGGV